MGYRRNLEVFEIVDQVLSVERWRRNHLVEWYMRKLCQRVRRW